MATNNFNLINKKFIDDINLTYERKVYLANRHDTLACDWIDELKERIAQLEKSNQKLHGIIGTSSFNQTQV